MNTEGEAESLSAEGQVRFLQGLHKLLNEGGFSATYKYALLLSITAVCAERGHDGAGRLRITTRELAEKFVELYWQQAAPYMPEGGELEGGVLMQNRGGQARVIKILSAARAAGGGSLDRLKADRTAWQVCLNEVEKKVREMPLWKLQTVGPYRYEFLYANEGGEEDFIELKEGACFYFRLYRDLIDDLVKGAWLRFVLSVRENGRLLGGAQDLESFMFGSTQKTRRR